MGSYGMSKVDVNPQYDRKTLGRPASRIVQFLRKIGAPLGIGGTVSRDWKGGSRVARQHAIRTRLRPMSPKLMATSGKDSPAEVTYEAALATRIAGVKLILAILNIAVILIDDTLPAVATPFALVEALSIAGIFAGYSLIVYLALKNHWVSTRSYRVTGPFVDIVFCSLLILGTDGYMSPFNLWLAMSIVASSFSSDQRIVLSATGLAVVLETLIACVPQSIPLDIPVFVVRTGFLLAFGLVIASIGNHIARKSFLLAAMDSYALAAALCDSVPEAADILMANLDRSLTPHSLTLKLDDGSTFSTGLASPRHQMVEYPVESGQARFGILSICPTGSIASDDERLLHTMLDRFCLTLRRVYASEELCRSAAQEARLRLADELHDTHIQTLTAIDLQVEGLIAAPQSEQGVVTGLRRIRNLARESSIHLREFIAEGPVESTDDLDEIILRARKHWEGSLEIEADESLVLTRAAWVAVGLLLKEGLANAKRHGHADAARFLLARVDEGYSATLLTNGKAPVLPLTKFGYGLTRVSAAVSAAGGQMLLSSPQQGGSSLSAVFTVVAE